MAAAAQGRKSWWVGLHLYYVRCILYFLIIWRRRILAESDRLETVLVEGWENYS